jgi:hypothetical protein
LLEKGRQRCAGGPLPKRRGAAQTGGERGHDRGRVKLTHTQTTVGDLKNGIKCLAQQRWSQVGRRKSLNVSTRPHLQSYNCPYFEHHI